MIVLGAMALSAVVIPLNDPAVWITDADYPVPAMERDKDGLVDVELSVGPDGRVSGCTVIETVGDANLDATTCRLLSERARFAPLQKSDITSARTYRQRVVWKIPDVNPIGTITTGVVAKISILPGGRLDTCVEERFGDQGLDMGDWCEISRQPKMLEYFAKDSLANLKTVYFRIVVTPQGTNELQIERPRASGSRQLIMKLSFEVSKTGFIKNCRTDQIDAIFAALNPCSGVSTSSPDFRPDPTLTKPKPMRVVIDILAEKRAEASAGNR